MPDIINAFHAGFGWAYSQDNSAQEFPSGDLQFSWKNRNGVREIYEFPFDETIFTIGQNLNSLSWDAGRNIGTKVRRIMSRLSNG